MPAMVKLCLQVRDRPPEEVFLALLLSSLGIPGFCLHVRRSLIFLHFGSVVSTYKVGAEQEQLHCLNCVPEKSKGRSLWAVRFTATPVTGDRHLPSHAFTRLPEGFLRTCGVSDNFHGFLSFPLSCRLCQSAEVRAFRGGGVTWRSLLWLGADSWCCLQHVLSWSFALPAGWHGFICSSFPSQFFLII